MRLQARPLLVPWILCLAPIAAWAGAGADEANHDVRSVQSPGPASSIPRAELVCGDGVCGLGESPCNCPNDCGPPATTETSCTDGADNDCDGSTDCSDGDCALDPACGTLLIAPGMDLWETPGGGTTFQDFSGMPLPKAFFDTGWRLPPGFFNNCAPPGFSSDPFFGRIVFRGQPLSTTPPGALGPTDTIVKRNAPAVLGPGESATVPIEIVALSLTSASPITVTYNGGTLTESWSVSACLSDSPQSAGQMTITRDPACPNNGGTFTSVLPVRPKLIFSRLTGPDCSVFFVPPESFAPVFTSSGHWLPFAPPPLGLFQSPGGVLVDGNCDGLADPNPLPPTSNFHPGLRILRCPGDACAGAPAKRLTEEEAMLAAHGVLPAEHDYPDQDGDGIPDNADNCAPPQHPPTFNPLQKDADGDGHGDGCDSCSVDCNAGQSDTDGDSLGDACDCAPLDASNPAPGAVASLTLAGETLVWSDEPLAASYSVLRGSVGALPVGPGGDDEICFDDLAGTTLTDADTPGVGQSYWYDVRAKAACGVGPYGEATSGPRASSTCPEPDDDHFGCPATSSCCEASAAPGCSDAACQAQICEVDPSCCTMQWGPTCAALAQIEPSCGCQGGGLAVCAQEDMWCVYDVQVANVVYLDGNCCAPLVDGAAGKLCRDWSLARDADGNCKDRTGKTWDISKGGVVCCKGTYTSGGGGDCATCPDGGRKVVPTN